MQVDQEELSLYQAFGNYATESLFWQLIYLESAIFNTPLRQDAKNKLMNMSKMYETIMTGIYPMGECRELVTAITNSNRLFVVYVEQLTQGNGRCTATKQQWRENGRQIAQMLCKINPYWQATEWTAMISHECDLLDTIATNMQTKNYAIFGNIAPVCRRLAIDMSSYMSSGIVRQRQDSWTY